jgi:hypothetical protein
MYYTRYFPKIRKYVVFCKASSIGGTSNVKWNECKLQTYFIAKKRIDYFVVINRKSLDKEPNKVAKLVIAARGFILLVELEKGLFATL